MSHAKLSPSAAERWITCPGSVVLSEGMPSKTSAFAEEGTRAHEVAEAVLTDKAITPAVNADMLANVSVYTDYVKSLGGELHVEQKVKVNAQVYGTADAVVWCEGTSELHIVDLKYGAGVAVEVTDNLQLKIYALATLLTFGYPAKTVTATVAQPRCPHSEGPVRSQTYDVVDLLDFHADLEDAAARVEKAVDQRGGSAKEPWVKKHITPSPKGCRWCLASPVCPALKAKAQNLAKQVFAKAVAYDSAELAKTLDDLPLIEGYIKNVREFAYEEAEKGAAIPDWKLVEKRATRKWRDDPSIVEHQILEATDLTTDDLYDAPSIKSPATLEKLLPKEKRGLLDELCTKESSGRTLVHASDKRPAIKVDAKSAFANL